MREGAACAMRSSSRKRRYILASRAIKIISAERNKSTRRNLLLSRTLSLCVCVVPLPPSFSLPAFLLPACLPASIAPSLPPSLRPSLPTPRPPYISMCIALSLLRTRASWLHRRHVRITTSGVSGVRRGTPRQQQQQERARRPSPLTLGQVKPSRRQLLQHICQSPLLPVHWIGT